MDFGDMVRRSVPSLVTAAAFGAGLLGIALLPSRSALALLAIALVGDALDGFIARRLGACSVFGSRFDLTADVVLVHFAGWALWGWAWWWVGPPVLALQVWADLRYLRGGGVRASGRACALLALLLVYGFGG